MNGVVLTEDFRLCDIVVYINRRERHTDRQMSYLTDVWTERDRF